MEMGRTTMGMSAMDMGIGTVADTVMDIADMQMNITIKTDIIIGMVTSSEAPLGLEFPYSKMFKDAVVIRQR